MLSCVASAPRAAGPGVAPRRTYQPRHTSLAVPAVHATGGARSRRAAAAATPSASSTTNSTDALQSAIAAKEAQLAAMFASGQPQPKAGVVAGLRKEISTLRGQLQAQLGIGGPTVGPTRSPAPSRTSVPAYNASPVAASAAAAASSATEKRMRDALMLAEARLAASRHGPGFGQLSAAQAQELLALQEENTALRAQLDAVLARQAQLQQLWEQHIVSKGGSAAPAVPAANGAAASSAAGKTNQQAATVVAA